MLDNENFVTAAIWPRDSESGLHKLSIPEADLIWSAAAEIRERLRQFEARTSIKPSARTSSAFLPYRPESSNPEKILDSRDWDLFVIDMPKINAFVLPTKEIFVYAGLIDLLEKEEPLIAAVMAHEISAYSMRPA